MNNILLVQKTLDKLCIGTYAKPLDLVTVYAEISAVYKFRGKLC